MHEEEIIGKSTPLNRSFENFEIKYINYIYYSWLLLLSCSLWYCDEIERKIRIDKILEVLNKLDCIEEQVLFFLFINIYKYGNKYHFIKLHKINLKFYKLEHNICSFLDLRGLKNMNYFFKFLVPQLLEYFDNDKEKLLEFIPKIVLENYKNVINCVIQLETSEISKKS